MDKTAAFVLVVVVLLAGAAGPGVALQGGPPDHANDDGNGPPDHANAGGDDGSDDDDDDESGDDGSGTDEEDGADDEDGSDDEDGGVTSVVDDAGDATPTATDRATATDSEESPTPTDPVETVLDILETPADTPEPTAEETREETEGASSQGTDESASQQQQQDPIPDPRETETPTPTPEPTETPEEEREETPASTPTATATSDDDGGDRDDDSGSTPRSDSEPTETPSEPTIEYDNGENVTRANVEDVRAGQTVEVPLRGPATDGEGVAVEAVDVGVESGEPFTLTVTRPTAEGGDDPAPGVPVAYFDAETDHDAVGNATLTVAVDESALPSGVAPEDLEVMRYADGEWQSTETTYDEEAGVYTAETDGLSTFALAAPGDGPLQVTDVEVDENGSGDGGAATVRATVENTVDRQATGTVAITVGGETVETREVTLGGGETATVAFDLPADRAEGETVAVGGVEAERFQVQDTERETAAGSIDGNLAFGVGAAAFLVISAVGTGLLAARRDEWDWER